MLRPRGLRATKPVRVVRGSRPYIFKTVGGAIDFVNDDLEDPERARPHWLRRVQRRAALSVIVAGSARSKAGAFGTKSTRDQTRIKVWLMNATSSQKQTSESDQAITSAPMRVNSNIV